jgi:hypothetical protein
MDEDMGVTNGVDHVEAPETPGTGTTAAQTTSWSEFERTGKAKGTFTVRNVLISMIRQR